MRRRRIDRLKGGDDWKHNIAYWPVLEEADKAAYMALDVKLAALDEQFEAIFQEKTAVLAAQEEQMAALKEQFEATFQEKIAVLSEQMNILKKYVSDEGLLTKLKRQQAELSELSESEERRPH
jgi:hypothetical protein